MPRPSGTAKLARRLGTRLRELRTEAGITQERLAWECDLSKPYLSQVEAGKRLPSVAVLGAIADRLGLELADLVALDTDRPRLKLLDAARRKDKAGVRAALKQLGLA